MKMLFSKIMKKCRICKCLTQKAIAEKTKIPLKVYTMYESGKRSIPDERYNNINKILDFGAYGDEYRQELQMKVSSFINSAPLQDLVTLERKVELIKEKKEEVNE